MHKVLIMSDPLDFIAFEESFNSGGLGEGRRLTPAPSLSKRGVKDEEAIEEKR